LNSRLIFYWSHDIYSTGASNFKNFEGDQVPVLNKKHSWTYIECKKWAVKARTNFKTSNGRTEILIDKHNHGKI